MTISRNLVVLAALVALVMGNSAVSTNGDGKSQNVHKKPPLDLGSLQEVCDSDHCKNGINKVIVDLGNRSYPIYIGSGLLKTGSDMRRHVRDKVLIVTNTIVGPLYSPMVRHSLESQSIKVYEVVLPDGEENKNMNVMMKIIDSALDARLDRHSTIIALGGGVIGDMAGFAAAVYLRGVDFVQVICLLLVVGYSSIA
jgi:3-dehydroquinate synthetase